MHDQMKRLYEAAEKLKGIVGQSEVARALNASPQTINNWEARGMSKAGMLNAQKVFGCSANWLSSGDGPMMLTPTTPPSMQRVVAAEPGTPGLVEIQKVKLRLSAGIMGFQVEPEQHDGSTLSVPLLWIQRRGYAPEKLVAIRVRGESMEPTLYEDDLVIVNTGDTKPVDGQVYAVNYEGEPVIKRLTRDAGRWWLTSDNSDQRKFHRKSCEGNECIIVGRVVKRESERF
jgi:phage repressor protein C with HTH and peptisase S24 domain